MNAKCVSIYQSWLFISIYLDRKSLCVLEGYVLNCSTGVSKFNLQVHHYSHFQTWEKLWTSVIPTSYGLNSATTVFSTKMDLALNNQKLIKETKSNILRLFRSVSVYLNEKVVLYTVWLISFGTIRQFASNCWFKKRNITQEKANLISITRIRYLVMFFGPEF